MPLPGSTTLSLQGLPKPGDALYSKPKQAMIVRMTPELLDSIGRGNGEIEFDFGGENQVPSYRHTFLRPMLTVMDREYTSERPSSP